MDVKYRVIMTVHEKDQGEEGKQLTPFYWGKGPRVVCRGRSKKEAEDYAARLQVLADTSTIPFIFRTYHVEKDYPESVV